MLRLQLLLFPLLLLASGSTFKEPLSERKARALDLFYKNKFAEALAIYERSPELLEKDKEAQFFAGICYYQLNQLAEAEQAFLELLQKNRSPFQEVLFFLAKTYHAQHEFAKAAEYYKSYLKVLDKNAPSRRVALEELRRSSNGISLQYKKIKAFTENLGRLVNTPFDEFAPVVSPNNTEKLYFSSKRIGNSGGLRNSRGLPDEENGSYFSDIYSCNLKRGAWGETRAMSYLINSPQHEVLYDFNSDGTTLIYFQGNQLSNGTILVDTFQKASERTLRSDPFVGPLFGQIGDRAPHFANDSVLVFSSSRPGGYGGFDLYKSTLRYGQWSPPRNLGPEINTAFDEISPFMARDGKTLYFSSNDSYKSIGDFDVFKAVFEEEKRLWTEPENVGLPINSAGEDSYFRLTHDGYSGFFSSSRKNDGYGQRDLYMVIFQEYQEEQTPPYSQPIALPEILPDDAVVVLNTEATKIEPEPEPALAASICFDNSDELLRAEHIQILDKIARLHQSLPETHVVVTAYSNSEKPVAQRLFSAIQYTNAVQEYLLEEGISANSIFCRSADVKELDLMTATGNASTTFKVIINLVDLKTFEIIPLTGLDLQPSQELDYTQLISDKIFYKVQIASVRKPYTKKDFSKYSDPMMEESTVDGYYRFTLGLFDNFDSAYALKKQLLKEGSNGAFVVPYVLGRRLERKEAKRYVDALPDLNNYLSGQ